MDHHSWTTLEWETAYKAVESLRKGPGTTQGISSPTEAHTARQRVFDALEVGGSVAFYDECSGYRIVGTVTRKGFDGIWAESNGVEYWFTVNDLYVGWLLEEEN